jgi:hypothetical protein
MKLIKLGFFFSCILILSSCSLEVGQMVANSHYVYPNSNVTALGKAYSEKSKMMILIPPNMSKKDYEQILNSAISKYPDGDILIDYGFDTKYTNYIIFWSMKTSVSGTVASMEVGMQDVGQNK